MAAGPIRGGFRLSSSTGSTTAKVEEDSLHTKRSSLKNFGMGTIKPGPYSRPFANKSTVQNGEGIMDTLTGVVKKVFSFMYTEATTPEPVRSAETARVDEAHMPLKDEYPVQPESIQPPCISPPALIPESTTIEPKEEIQQLNPTDILSDLILNPKYKNSKVAAYQQIGLFFEAKQNGKLTQYEFDQLAAILRRLTAGNIVVQQHFKYPMSSGVVSAISLHESPSRTNHVSNTVESDVSFSASQPEALKTIIPPSRVFTARFDDDIEDDYMMEDEGPKSTGGRLMVPVPTEIKLNLKPVQKIHVPQEPAGKEVKQNTDTKVIDAASVVSQPKPIEAFKFTAPSVKPISEADLNVKPPKELKFDFGAPTIPVLNSSAPSETAANLVAGSSNVAAFSFSTPKPKEESSDNIKPFSFGVSKEKPKTEFTFGSVTKEAFSAPPASAGATVKDANPLFSFGSAGSKLETESKTPAFSFGPLKETESKQVLFSFGFPPSTSEKTISEPSKTSFGDAKLQERKSEEAEKLSKPFTFGSTDSGTKPFSFGSTVTDTSKPFTFDVTKQSIKEEPTEKKNSEPSAFAETEPMSTFGQPTDASKTVFTFGAPKEKASFASAPTAEEKKPLFTFGAPKEETKPVSFKQEEAPKSVFSFGQPATDIKPFTFGTSAPSEETKFSFESENKTSSGFTFGGIDTKQADTKQEPKPFTFGQTASDTLSKPFSSGQAQTDNTTKPFTFGQSQTETVSKPFTFGQPQSGTASTFGQSQSENSTKPFAFGQSPSDSTTKPFAFGQSQSDTFTKTFAFGQQPSSTFGTQEPTKNGLSFGSAPAQSSSQQAAPFQFGSQPSASGFSFSPAPVVENDAPSAKRAKESSMFSFSAPPATSFSFPAPQSQDSQPSAFTFGSSSSQPPAQFTFGGAQSQPTQPFVFGQAESESQPSLTFNMGSSSPALGGRPKTTPVSRRRPHK